jgi:capping protein beta
MDPYSAALDLLRRLPPTNVAANLDVISRLCPDIAEDLAVSVDQPLQLKSDGESGKEYLCCDYNRDGESYRWVWLLCGRFYRLFTIYDLSRSPWSNAYSPPLADGAVPSETLRDLEVGMNEAFDTYREM